MKQETNKAAGPEAGGTSGQSVHKSKFRQKSKQEQAAASKLRMEQRGEKLEKAKDKLAKQKPPKKPGPVKRVGRTAGRGVHGFVHGKLFEVEQENVGTEGAHRSELVGESALRHGSRFIKKKVREHPAKAVHKAESKYIKATADYHFRMAAQEHPEMSGNSVSRMWRKHRLKKQYQKKAREAAKTGAASAAKKTAAATEKAGAKIAGFVKRHPVGVLLALACLLLLFVMQSCSSSLVMLGNSGAGAVGATTYPSKDEDILAAEASYSGMEAELRHYLDTYESTHSYDEYHFDLDGIEHDPYVLISILSVLHEGEWTADEVQGTLETLFDRQYILTERVVRETRYDSEGDPYSWYICYVTLENRKGPAYERWAKVYNIKQMAAALLYLREHGLADYEALAASTEAAVDRFHTLAGELRDTEATLSHTSQLMGAVVQYAKTRPVFDGYKAARYSKKYLAQHETELSDYRAAKAAMNELLDGAKLPKMDALKKKRRELAEKKKALYAEYRKAQADMREAVAVKGNIDHLLGHTDERDKAQER